MQNRPEGLNCSEVQLTSGLINKVSRGQLRDMKEQKIAHCCHVLINH